MRTPKHLNTRLLKRQLLRFGAYEKVVPYETTPPRSVPDDIEKPRYATSGIPDVPKSIDLKTEEEIVKIRRSCELASHLLNKVDEFIKPGITTDAIDELVHNLSIKASAYPSPLNYKGFPKSVCTSVNNVAVHGIPDLRPLIDGDIVNVDITVYKDGFHGDCSRTFAVGNVDDRGLELIQVTEECLQKGIDVCGPGVPLYQIGRMIHVHAKKHRLSVLPAFVGHGIGKYFHGPPDIYHTKNRYPGVMKPGMTFTIEPALSHGLEMVYILSDGWTVVTGDSARAAQAEHTVLITEDGAEILTL